MVQLAIPNWLMVCTFRSGLTTLTKIGWIALIVADTYKDLLLVAEVPVDAANDRVFSQRATVTPAAAVMHGGIDSEIMPWRPDNRGTCEAAAP